MLNPSQQREGLSVKRKLMGLEWSNSAQDYTVRFLHRVQCLDGNNFMQVNSIWTLVSRMGWLSKKLLVGIGSEAYPGSQNLIPPWVVISFCNPLLVWAWVVFFFKKKKSGPDFMVRNAVLGSEWRCLRANLVVMLADPWADFKDELQPQEDPILIRNIVPSKLH